MRPFPYFLLFLFLSSIASATSVTRNIYINGSYYNSSSGYILVGNQYQITLTPSSFTDFDVPGYYVTEYLPGGFSFIGTNADKYTFNGSKFTMLKFLPTSDNLTLKYTIQYKTGIDQSSSFYGTYLDKNRNYGVISQSVINTTTQYPTSSGITSSSSGTTPSNTVAVPIVPTEIKPITTPLQTPQPLQIVNASLAQSFPSSSDYTPIVAFLFVVVIGIFTISLPYRRRFGIKILKSGDIFIDKKFHGTKKELKFELLTKSPLSVKIEGDITSIITSTTEIPSENRCFVITISPDNKGHEGKIIFVKKNIKLSKYKVRSISTVGTTGFKACLSNLNREAMKQEASRL
jgi:hypothetical protein